MPDTPVVPVLRTTCGLCGNPPDTKQRTAGMHGNAHTPEGCTPLCCSTYSRRLRESSRAILLLTAHRRLGKQATRMRASSGPAVWHQTVLLKIPKTETAGHTGTCLFWSSCLWCHKRSSSPPAAAYAAGCRSCFSAPPSPGAGILRQHSGQRAPEEETSSGRLPCGTASAVHSDRPTNQLSKSSLQGRTCCRGCCKHSATSPPRAMLLATKLACMPHALLVQAAI